MRSSALTTEHSAIGGSIDLARYLFPLIATLSTMSAGAARPFSEDYSGRDDADPEMQPGSSTFNSDGLWSLLYIILAGLALAYAPKRWWFLKPLALLWPIAYLAIAMSFHLFGARS